MSDVLIGGVIKSEGIEFLKSQGHKVFIEGVDVYDPASIEAIVLRCTQFGVDMMSRFPRLRVIARHGVGVDNIDLEEAKRRNIYVTNTPEANWLAVAEHTVADLLLMRKRLFFCDDSVRTGRFSDRNVSWKGELPGLIVGIVGYGRIGSAVSRILHAGFRTSIVVYDPYKTAEEDGIHQVDSLDELLQVSQVLSLHIPLTEETRNMIGERELNLLPDGALVINTARGEVLDLAVLVDFLNSGKLGGASVDVFSEEPPSLNHPMMDAPNLVLSPHKAGLTEEALIRMSLGAGESVVEVLAGRIPENIV